MAFSWCGKKKKAPFEVRSKVSSAQNIATERLNRLRRLKLFVLDNSVRETTVAQTKGHTLQDKWKIMEFVRKSGLRHQIIGTFAKQRRVDDQFAPLVTADSRYAGQRLYAFSELADAPAPPTLEQVLATLPVGLQRCAEYGISNIILEMDSVLSTEAAIVHRFRDGCVAVLEARLRWIRKRFGPDARIFLNVRDFVIAHEDPSRAVLEKVVRYLAALPVSERIHGLLFEDPSGACFPAQLAAYVARTVDWMAAAGWRVAGHLSEAEAQALAQAGGSTLHFGIHFHNNYGLAEAAVLEALAAGADCVWCGIAREGAQTGHANSLPTIVNLQRLGNKDALCRYNAAQLRTAAIDITRVVTGQAPAPHTELYGSRALDICFDPHSGMGALATGSSASAANSSASSSFDLAQHLAIKPTVRVSTMITPVMFAEKMTQTFGEPPVELKTKVKLFKAATRAHLFVRSLTAQAGVLSASGRAGVPGSALTNRDSSSSDAAVRTVDTTLGDPGDHGEDEEGMVQVEEEVDSDDDRSVVRKDGSISSKPHGGLSLVASSIAIPSSIPLGVAPTLGEEDPYHGFAGWDPAVMRQMWANVNRDLTSGIKEEYNTPEALERLYVRSGGVVFHSMTHLLAQRAVLLAAHTPNPVVREARECFQAIFGACSDAELAQTGAPAPTRDKFWAVVADVPEFAQVGSHVHGPGPEVSGGSARTMSSWPPLFIALCQMCETVDARPSSAGVQLPTVEVGLPRPEPASVRIDLPTPSLSLDLALSRIVRAVAEYPEECSSLYAAWGCIARRMLIPVVVAARRRAMWNKRARLFRAAVRVAAQLSRTQAAQAAMRAGSWGKDSKASVLASRSSRRLVEKAARERASSRAVVL